MWGDLCPPGQQLEGCADTPALGCGDGVMQPSRILVPPPAPRSQRSLFPPGWHLPQARPGWALSASWTLERRSCAAAAALPRGLLCWLPPALAPCQAVPLWHTGSATALSMLELR